MHREHRQARYSSSVTCSPHSLVWPFSPRLLHGQVGHERAGPGPVPVPLARPGLHGVPGPGSPPVRRPGAGRGAPSVTCSTWPNGCRCHAVRAPGAKWTLSTLVRDGGTGAAISSIQTWPVNQSRGPGVLSARFLRISMACADSLG